MNNKLLHHNVKSIFNLIYCWIQWNGEIAHFARAGLTITTYSKFYLKFQILKKRFF